LREINWRITRFPQISDSKNAVTAAATARNEMYWKTFRALRNSELAPLLKWWSQYIMVS
jgi:hypothetical protein